MFNFFNFVFYSSGLLLGLFYFYKKGILGEEFKEKPEKNRDIKGIAILGSTGNIGVQALDVFSAKKSYFRLKLLSAGTNVNLLIEQAKQYKPEMVFIANKEKRNILKQALANENTIVLESEENLYDSFYQDDLHLVLMAIVGFAGLQPSLEAIKAKKDLAIANKESLVVGGGILMPLAKANNVRIIPVDSEHSAIFQCLIGEESSSIEKIILTASGGPFYKYSLDEIKKIELKDALKHPTWSMGQKVTIDSASLMNKGLEAIEAHWLFNLPPEKIDVTIHPQSIIHSMVQFNDGSIKAQMGPPDMRSPIHFAMHYPQREQSNLTRFNFLDHHQLSFSPVDTKKFRNLALAFEAMKKGGNLPAILNAANEAAVEALLQDQIEFFQISEVVETMMNTMEWVNCPSLIDLQNTHDEVFKKSKEIIQRIN